MLKITLLLLCLFLYFELHIIVDGLRDERTVCDVGLILGNKVNEDGSLSARLKSRLDKGIELYSDSLFGEILVSGGFGKEGHYEGSVMASYLESQGIPKSRIKVDNEGMNTRATARNFEAIYGKNRSVLVVSQFYHIHRTKLALSQMGIKEIGGVHSDYYELRDIYSLLREFFGVLKYRYWY